MTEAPQATPPGGGVPQPHVTAVVVTRGITDHVRATLAGLAAQTRPVDHTVVVDVSDRPTGVSEHAGRHRTPDRGATPDVTYLLTDWPGPVTVVRAPGARTFGDGVRTGLSSVPDSPPRSDEDGPGWLWLLHDDSSPGPTALAVLLHAVEGAPSVAVAGCKQVTWSEPLRVLEVGLATSRFGRRMTGLDEPEIDQGQHDGREDVLAVGIAGALVRRTVWDALGGTDPALGPYGDGLDLSRRARLAGHRVVVVPQAVVRHARASLAPSTPGSPEAGRDARRSARARREAYLHSQLVGVPAPLVPVVVVLAVVSGLVRALGRLVTKEPHLVVAELVAPWAVLVRPGRVLRARRVARATRRLPRRSLRPLQAGWREVVRQQRDRRLSAAERRRRELPSDLELAELAALRRRRRAALAGVLAVAAALTAVVLGPLVRRVLGGDRLTGGALGAGGLAHAVPGDVWEQLTSGWVPAGWGAPAPVDPLTLVLLPMTAVVGSVGAAGAVILLTALMTAAAGGWFAAGAATRSIGLRAWAALVWAGAPALLIGLGQGRLGPVLAHVALPWVVLGVARAVGAARVDTVQPALAPKQDPSTTVPSGPVPLGPVPSTTVPPATATSTAEPSMAAAAGAGLAFAVVTAGAPVLLPFGLLALLAVAACARRRRRLVWVVIPALALHGPTIAVAVGRWSSGGWRALVADPGFPVASTPAPSPYALLGWPVAPTDWSGWPQGPEGSLGAATSLGAVLPLAATGVVTLAALVALALSTRPGRGAHAVRAGWLVTACGLAAAVVAARVDVAVADDPLHGQVLTSGWAGSGVSLATAGLLTAAVVGAGGARAAVVGCRAGQGRRWRPVVAAGAVALAVAGPVTVLAGWAWQGRGAELSLLSAARVPVVPAVGVQLQAGPDDVRVLALTPQADGGIDAAVLRHDGRRLSEASRTAAAHAVVGAEARADGVRARDTAEQALALLVAQLASGAPVDVAAALADLGVGAVQVPPLPDGPIPAPGVPAPEPDGAPMAEAAATTETSLSSQTRDTLIAHIDSTLGLERVTETESGVIWRVAATELGTTAAWARLVAETDGPPGRVVAPVPADDGLVSADVPTSAGPRLLVLAERADPGWRAWLDGRPLDAVDAAWQQTFDVGTEAGHLTVRHVAPGATAWLVVEGVVLLATVLLALPVGRRRWGLR